VRTRDFHYELPEELIAQEPVEPRPASRLLWLDAEGGILAEGRFADLARWLRPGDLLVLNDTRVIPARLRGRKASGGRVELLVERVLPGGAELLAHLRASRPPRPGARLLLGPEEAPAAAEVLGREEGLYRLRLEGAGEGAGAWELLQRHGEPPLPPYIRRRPGPADRERYQTVFARRPGAVAAPTAGLHFDRALLAELERRGVERAWVTLHVGAGTFQPVRAERVEEHRLHPEAVEVGEATCRRVAAARARGGRVVAVGTTVVRALESAWDEAAGALRPLRGETRLFIYPGHRFRAVDAMVTNFHLPGSTLLMLVCAFAGRERVLAAYRHAVARRYRFFSYGDAMFLTRGEAPPAAEGWR